VFLERDGDLKTAGRLRRPRVRRRGHRHRIV